MVLVYLFQNMYPLKQNFIINLPTASNLIALSNKDTAVNPKHSSFQYLQPNTLFLTI